MSYKIAVASSDGKQIDETFGSAKRFMIYEVELVRDTFAPVLLAVSTIFSAD